MLFQLETKNLETGLVYKSPLFSSFAEAREEARAVSMAGRRTVRVVQVVEAEPSVDDMWNILIDIPRRETNCKVCGSEFVHLGSCMCQYLDDDILEMLQNEALQKKGA